MGLYRCSNEHDYPSYKGYQDEKKKFDFGCCHHEEEKKDCEEDKKGKKDDCVEDCDSDSARALKKILGLLDDLNVQDLRILDEIIERILCGRSKKGY